MKGNPVRTLADSIASEYLEAEMDAVPFQLEWSLNLLQLHLMLPLEQ